MEFLVEIEIVTETQDDREAISRLTPNERDYGRRLVEAGHITRIWRVPGRRANVAIWKSENATELHALLSELPLFPWLDIKVTPLATHPLEASTGST